MLQHLRVEENPILKMSHLEAASILLVGPTLKKFNDRGILIPSFNIIVTIQTNILMYLVCACAPLIIISHKIEP